MTANDNPDTLSILIATDNHLGYLERDPIRGQDSFHAFSEIMELARLRKVDMVLLGGDLFHDNKPSRRCLHQALTTLRQACLGPSPVALEYLSDPSTDLASSSGSVNYEDPNLNVCLPVFTIHGNHDDPSGDGNLSAVDMLAAAGLVNYFGRQQEVERIRVSPVLLRKGETRLALYGLGNIRDERLHRTMAKSQLTMCQPTEDAGKWFNVMVLHQNRAAHGPKNHIPEHFLSDCLDFVVWGHEHQCLVDAEYNHQRAFYVSQPGSSVATALSPGEASPKHVAVLKINRRNFRLDKIRLRNVRPFVIEDIVLAAVPALSPQSTEGEIVDFLSRRVERMLASAQQQYAEQMESSDQAVHSALGLQPKPLIRLRVEYSGGFETFHPQRFGLLFADRVANPRDIVYFFRRPRPASTGASHTQSSVSSLVPAPVDAVHVESLIGEFLDDSSMRLLVDLELAEAVRLFVQKGDADAIAQSLRTTIADTQRRVLGEGGSRIVAEEQVESCIGATRVARRQHALESGLVDSARLEAAPASCAGRNGAGRNAAREPERAAAVAPAGASEEEEDDDEEFRRDLRPPRPGAARARRESAAPAPVPAKRPRTKQPTDSSSSSDENEDFVSTGASSNVHITRPSRNARTTLASTTISRASVVSTDDSEAGAIIGDNDSLPSSIAATPAARRGRGAATRARKPAAGRRPRGGGRSRGATATQRSATLPSSQLPTVTIDDDNDNDRGTGGFGGFSLKKRT
ncbi:meiotic recombination [Coemansia sp. BCRC 34301]|nr:meiotic recombination [Coemansia sp. BCRC 34301]